MWRWAPAALAAAGLIALVAGLAGSGGESPPRAVTAQPRPADPLAYPSHGLRLARPPGWSAELRDDVIRLRSADARVSVAVVMADRSVAPARLERDLVRALRDSSGGQEPRSRPPTTLGDAAARMTELRLEDARGRSVEAAVLSARSRWRTYGVTVFNATGRPLSTSADVAAVLNSFEFGEPA